MSDSTTGPLAQQVTPGATAADLGIQDGCKLTSNGLRLMAAQIVQVQRTMG